MVTGKTRIACFIFGILILATGNAFAQTPKVWITAGAKGAVGGNYLSKPDNTLENFVLPFDDGAGGIGGGGGIFGDVRFLNQHLGFELDLLLDGNKTWCNINDVDIIIKYTSLRIPILVKAGGQTGIVRISAGIGPEFRIGLNASTDLETDNSAIVITDADKEAFAANKRTDIALAWELALGFMVKRIEITLDLRFTANLTLPKDYRDRVQSGAGYQTAEIEAAHSVDGRIMVGAGYVFTAGK